MKKHREMRCHIFGGFVTHQSIWDSHAFDILGEDPGAVWKDLIGDQQTVPMQKRGNMGAFAAGSRTQITDQLSGLWVQQAYHGHGTGLLDK